jgi:hypothetical protein
MMVLCGLMILCAFAASAQTSSLFYLKIADDAGGHDSLIYGNNTSATFGLDGALGEFNTPPDPPGFFAKFQCPRSPVPSDWGTGLLHKDLRHLPENYSSTRVDTFILYFKNDDTGATHANALLTWSGCLYYDSMIMVPPSTNSINMLTHNNTLLSDFYDPEGNNPTAPVVKVKIFVYGIRPPFDEVKDHSKKQLPTSFALYQNYPNPFNPSTIIQFDIPTTSFVSLKIYNILGQEVATLVNEIRTPGKYSADFDGSKLSSGIYFYRLMVGSVVETRKMVVVK